LSRCVRLDISSSASSCSSASQPTVVVILEVVVVLQDLIRDALLCWFRCFWMVVAILGYNFQYSSPRRKEGLNWSLLWGLERVFILLCFAGRRWYVDLIRFDGWSIHCGLDIYLRGCFNPLMLFLIFVLPAWVNLHFVDKLVRYMSPSFLFVFSLFFLIIYIPTSGIRLEFGTNLVGSHSFLCHLFRPYKKKNII